MRKLIILLCCFSLNSLFGQNSHLFWQSTNEAIIEVAPGARTIIPDHYEAFHLDLEALKNTLKEAPLEFSAKAKSNPLLLDIPLPDGTMVTFEVTESSVMKPGLAAKYAYMKSYIGHSTAEGGIKLRFTVTQLGFNGVMTKLVNKENFYIDNYAPGETEYYICYNVKDHHPDIPEQHLICGLDEFGSPITNIPNKDNNPSNNGAASARGAGDLINLRVYTIAITTTGEWAAPQGSVANVLAKITQGVARLNQIFEVEVSLRFIMADNSDMLIFMDPGTDPFPDSQNSGQMIGLNTGVINDIIGFANYDIGHLFDNSCNTGGLASLGAVCGNNKGSAITCHYTNDFEFAMTQITAHEIGHSFNATHTWNRCSTTNLDNINSGTAYEPGSGNTIMSYYGVCDQSQNVEDGPHDYYHANSLERIYDFMNGPGSNCPETTLTENHFPEVTLPYNNGFYIPISTPFDLRAEATDEDGDMLTYSWEQYNLSSLNTLLGFPEGDEPSFRSFPPTPNALRTFPRMQSIVTNTTTPGEVLPAYTRNLTFRCSVRDNNPIIGGTTWAEMSFEATAEAGPFRVTYPTFNTTWTVGEDIEVTWDVANTDGALVNCQKVNILLSTDGGYNYPITLAENVPNNGSRIIVVPQAVTSIARVRVEAADNIFFDISNTNFTIQEATVAGFNFDAGPYEQQICLPANPVIDIPMISILNFTDPVTFNVTGLPVGAIANFTNNPASPITGTELTIDMSNADPNSNYFEVIIEGMVEGVDTHTRIVYLDVVSNDFSALALSGPSYGQLGVTETPTFEWSTTGNADFYEFQLATNPSFAPGTIVDEQTGLTGPPYSSSILLERSTPYYWRVRPFNRCGAGLFTTTSAFHTEVLSCSEYFNNSSINISSAGTPTVESIIEVPQGGNINDVNVTQIKGQHDLIRHIAVSLVSPAGTESELFSAICPGSNSAPFNLGIDDNSPLSISCPPISGAPMLPETPGALGVFNGESSQGLWTLKVSVINGDGNGGSLDNWSLQICSNASTAAPFLVNNNVLLVPPGAFNYVLIDQLLCDDTDNTANELIYTLLEKPTQGNLIFNGNTLEIGETFRQTTINAGNLTYENTPGSELTDQFVFTVSDGNGGWIPPTVFEIQMDENAVVGVTDLKNNNQLLVFPNPAKDILNVQLANPVNAAVEVRLYNIQGQLVATQLSKTGMDLIQFEANQLSAGLYFVELNMGGQSLVEKVAVYK